jgi:hypothetical protein
MDREEGQKRGIVWTFTGGPGADLGGGVGGGVFFCVKKHTHQGRVSEVWGGVVCLRYNQSTRKGDLFRVGAGWVCGPWLPEILVARIAV